MSHAEKKSNLNNVKLLDLKTNMTLRKVRNFTNGFASGLENSTQETFFPTISEMVSDMVTEKNFPDMFKGFIPTLDYTLSVVLLQDPTQYEDTGARNKRVLQEILNKNVDPEDRSEVVHELVDKKPLVILTIDKIKSIKWSEIREDLKMTIDQAGEICGISGQSYYQVEHRLKKGDAKQFAAGTIRSLSILYRYMNKAKELRQSTRTRVDQALEKLSTMINIFDAEARKGTNVNIPVTRCADFSAFAKEIVEILKPADENHILIPKLIKQ